MTAKRIEENTGKKIKLNIKNNPDIRNYKVNFDKIQTVFGYRPTGSIETIVDDLQNNLDKFEDFDNNNYYNIKVFKEQK